MNPLEYLHLQLRLEGMQVVHGDRLHQVEVVPDEEVPLMVLVQLVNGQVVSYYDESLPAALHDELNAHVRTITFPAIDPLLAVLEAHTVSVDVGHYRTYVFAEELPPKVDDEIICYPGNDPRIISCCIEREGKVVSACVSTRENAQCGEAWVYTDEAYRRQGLAQRTVNAWAYAMREAGKVPFYSHKLANTASASLAKRLGLQPTFEEIAITYMNV